MKNYFLNIKNKLKEKIKIENIEIIDNSSKHMHHKFYSPEKFVRISLHQVIFSKFDF